MIENNQVSNNKAEERKLLFNAMLEQSKLYDKTIISISAGAYGLSLSILSNFKPIEFDSIIYIKIAWYAFGASIVLTLISFYTSYKACKRNLEIINNNNNTKNKWSFVNNIMNALTFILFIVGFICLTNFGIINISKEEIITMSDDKPKKIVRIEEGFTPPKPPQRPQEKPPKEPPGNPSKQ